MKQNVLKMIKTIKKHEILVKQK